MATARATETAPTGLAKASELVRRPYFLVFVMLALITVFELQVPTRFADFLQKPQQVAILIATSIAKASLVALYYMHLRYEPLVLRYVPLVPIGLMAILVLTLIL